VYPGREGRQPTGNMIMKCHLFVKVRFFLIRKLNEYTFTLKVTIETFLFFSRIQCSSEELPHIANPRSDVSLHQWDRNLTYFEMQIR